MKKFIKYLSIFAITLLGLPKFARAICNIDYNTGSVGEYGQKLINLIDTIVKFIGIIGIGIALIVVIIGGINYITSGGNDEKATKARKFITYGLVGFAIVIAAGFILCFIAELINQNLST